MGGGGRKEGIFGVGAAWRRSKTTGADAATTATASNNRNQKPSKRKRSSEKQETHREQGGGDEEEGGGGGGKRRRHRRSAGDDDDDAGDEPSASPGRFTLRGLRRAGSPAVNPWKRHSKTLRAVAEHEARTVLLRRARLRAQVSALPRLRRCWSWSWCCCRCRFWCCFFAPCRTRSGCREWRWLRMVIV